MVVKFKILRVSFISANPSFISCFCNEQKGPPFDRRFFAFHTARQKVSTQSLVLFTNIISNGVFYDFILAISTCSFSTKIISIFAIHYFHTKVLIFIFSFSKIPSVREMIVSMAQRILSIRILKGG